MTEYHECESRGACDDVREELNMARAEIAQLRAVLKPFADVDINEVMSPGDLNLSKQDFVRARDAFHKGDAPPADEPPQGRPQDPHLDGRDLKFETLEHGGAEPDTMPNAIRVTDPEGRMAVYVFLRTERKS